VFSIGNRPIDVAEFIELHKASKEIRPALYKLDQFSIKMLRHGVTLNDADSFPSLWHEFVPLSPVRKRHNTMRIQTAMASLCIFGLPVVSTT